MQTLFGGSSSKTSNTASGYLDKTFAPQIQNGVGANTAAANLLGVGANPGAQDNAFNGYLNSTGYKFQLGQGMDAITQNAATRGLLNSGATLKAGEGYGQNLASNYFNNYLQQLSGLTQAGTQAGSLVGSAGQQSQSSSTNGIIPVLWGG